MRRNSRGTVELLAACKSPSSPSRGLSLASTTVTANLSPTRAVNICSRNLAINMRRLV